MTFVGGFSCRDGLVIFTDSYEGDQYTKSHVNKLKVVESGDLGNEWGICLAGSGDVPLINNFFDRLVDKIPEGRQFDRLEIESDIQLLLKSLKSRKSDVIPQFVIGLFSNNPNVSRLYRTDDTCLWPQDQACSIGQDSTLSHFVISTLINRIISVKDAARLGFLVTRLMAKHGAGVEEPVNIATCHLGDVKWKIYDPGEVNTISKMFDGSQIEWAVWNWWEKLTR